MKRVVAASAVVFALSAAFAFPAGPKGTEWESEQELGLNKLPPRAWFGHFPDTESAKGIMMQTSPWHRFLDSETDWRFKWTGVCEGQTRLIDLTNALACCNLMHPAFVMTVGDLYQRTCH